MMKLPIYQIDAFADGPFTGNPAAVVPLGNFLDDAILQGIALENNLSETAFIVAGDDPAHWKLRWFTPGMEVPLCGHATFAAGACILRHFHAYLDTVHFSSQSGPLSVARDGDGFVMDLPAGQPHDWAMPEDAAAALGLPIKASGISTYPFVVLKDEAMVRTLDPQKAIAAAHAAHPSRELVICAPGQDDLDVVLRFFAPGAGVDEDPVTGSAITYIAPYWAERLGTEKMHFFQASPRGGHVRVQVCGERVRLGGQALDYLHGDIYL